MWEQTQGLRDAESVAGGLFYWPPSKEARLTKKKHARADHTPKKFHIDKRASAIATATMGNDDELLNTPQMATWLGVSPQWLEIRRHRGDGPPFERISQRCVRYRRGKVKAWLNDRTYKCTSEYA
jgi:predicted DNA-binding transcriptional regulator AlpA